ncbi:unnamed protein product [Lampetra fluviatilis]
MATHPPPTGRDGAVAVVSQDEEEEEWEGFTFMAFAGVEALSASSHVGRQLQCCAFYFFLSRSGKAGAPLGLADRATDNDRAGDSGPSPPRTVRCGEPTGTPPRQRQQQQVAFVSRFNSRTGGFVFIASGDFASDSDGKMSSEEEEEFESDSSYYYKSTPPLRQRHARLNALNHKSGREGRRPATATGAGGGAAAAATGSGKGARGKLHLARTRPTLPPATRTATPALTRGPHVPKRSNGFEQIPAWDERHTVSPP